jgi:UDP-2,4-diacetamido-2,4,6-trideoxy-beta-L-altropyranose hydrolase
VDASIAIGTGHFMRCFTLANQLLEQGASVVFVCRHWLPALANLLEQKGIELKTLPPASPHANASDPNIYAGWLGTSQLLDAEDTIRVLSGNKVNWLIIDHYALDHTWESELRASTDKIMVIDDLANRQHGCDLLLDQNYYHDDNNPYQDLVTSGCLLLLGPKYALLRPEFRKLREKIKRGDNQICRVLIFFGGVDENDYTSKAIEAISGVKNLTFTADVVIGAQHPNKDNIIRACQRLDYRCHVQTNKMAELIAHADIGIGAGGSATWERCALGLPAITLCVADNQQMLCQNAAKAGLIYFAEWAHYHLIEDIRIHFEAMLKNPFMRKGISEKAMQMVDANGVERIISHLDTTSLLLRVAKVEDMKCIFKWRNHPEIRAISRNQQTINWNDHQAWFERMLTRVDIKLLIASKNQTDVGVVRFDLNDSSAEISIYLVPKTPHNGLGTKLLNAAENWLQSHHPEINEISAEVLASNPKSQQFFIKNGYSVTSNLLVKRLHQ